VGKLCLTVLGIFARCTGGLIRAKDVTGALKGELPKLLPEYVEATKGSPSEEAAFSKERAIGPAELDRLLPEIKSQYEELPVAGPPPDGADRPPAPDWGEEPPPSQMPAGGGTSAVKALRGSGGNPKKLSEEELAYFKRVGGDVSDEEEDPKAAAVGTRAIAKGSGPKPARCWMAIHCVDFKTLNKDMPSFKHLFIKSVAAALQLPHGCIEVIDVVKGSVGVVVDFMVHPSGRRDDRRNSKKLLLQLEAQLASPNSMLRRGHFASYASAAMVWVGESRSKAVPIAGGAGFCQTQETQATDQAELLAEVLRRVALAQQRTEEAVARRLDVLEEVQKRESTATLLRTEEGLREAQRLQMEEEKRMKEEAAERKRLEWERLIAEEKKREEEERKAFEELTQRHMEVYSRGLEGVATKFLPSVGSCLVKEQTPEAGAPSEEGVETYGFVVEWHDEQEDQMHEYSLTVIQSSSENLAVSMYDSKMKLCLLRQVQILGLRLQDFLQGSTVTILGRLLTVKSYNDDRTRVAVEPAQPEAELPPPTAAASNSDIMMFHPHPYPVLLTLDVGLPLFF